MPGKASKLEEAQKNVLSHSLTKMQLGSGWKPGSTGLVYVVFEARHDAATKALKPKKKEASSAETIMDHEEIRSSLCPNVGAIAL